MYIVLWLLVWNAFKTKDLILQDMSAGSSFIFCPNNEILQRSVPQNRSRRFYPFLT